MNNFLRRFFLFFLVIAGTTLMVCILPIIGDYLKSLSLDNRWIALSFIMFFTIVLMSYHHIQKCEDERQLKHEENLGYYKDEN